MLFFSLTALLITIWALSLARSGWGPGTHIVLRNRFLAQSDRLPADKRALIEAHPACFSYGLIAADIINIKGYGGIQNHCHHWNIRERFEALAQEPEEQVFCLGYLCHLAADVVAHNHFVPFHLLYGLPAYIYGHSYWEGRLDVEAPNEVWEAIDELRTHSELALNDKLIQKAVPRKALSMRSNKLIFNYVLLARSRASWRRFLDRIRLETARSRLQEEFTEACLDRALELMFTVFDPQAFARVLEYDPTGKDALKETRRLRRRVKAQHKNAKAAQAASRRLADEVFGL